MADSIWGVTGKRAVRQSKSDGFTEAKRIRFLDSLSLTCNIKQSAELAGVDFTTVYRRRQKDPVFAARWQEALDMGRVRLEALILEHGGAGVPIEADVDRAEAGDTAKFDFNRAVMALRVAHEIQARIEKTGRDRESATASREATTAALLKAMERIAMEADPDER